MIIAETGGDMARFAWAGLAPGDNESAGKPKKAPTRKGDEHLRAAMVQAAWATARAATRPGARFRRLARRFGMGNEKKAAVAVAHTLLSIAWAVMRYNGDYVDAGTDYYDQRNREHPALARLAGPGPAGLPGHPPPRGGSPPPAPTTTPSAAPHQAA